MVSKLAWFARSPGFMLGFVLGFPSGFNKPPATSEQDGTEPGDFQGAAAGEIVCNSLGLLTNRTFDASSPGVTSLGTLEGAMDGGLLGRIDGCAVG